MKITTMIAAAAISLAGVSASAATFHFEDLAENNANGVGEGSWGTRASKNPAAGGEFDAAASINGAQILIESATKVV